MSKILNSGDYRSYEENENSKMTRCYSYNSPYIYVYKYDSKYQADHMIATRFRNQDACYIYGHYFSSDKPYARCF